MRSPGNDHQDEVVDLLVSSSFERAFDKGFHNEEKN